jgi:hypothetical protein
MKAESDRGKMLRSFKCSRTGLSHHGTNTLEVFGWVSRKSERWIHASGDEMQCLQ